MRKLYFRPQKRKKNSSKKNRIFVLAWNIVYWLLKSHSFEFLRGGKYGLSWARKLMGIWYLLITKTFLFWTFREWEIRSLFETKVSEKMILLATDLLLFWIFRGWKIRHFLKQKIDGNMIFTGYWKVLVLSFLVMGNNGLFFSQKVDVKVIFTWSFWAFHDILGLGKDGFLCSVSILIAW